MKSSDRLPSITAPLLKDALAQDQLNQAGNWEKLETPQVTTSEIKPPKPAELDQDPGGSYNPQHIFPQQ